MEIFAPTIEPNIAVRIGIEKRIVINDIKKTSPPIPAITLIMPAEIPRSKRKKVPKTP